MFKNHNFGQFLESEFAFWIEQYGYVNCSTFNLNLSQMSISYFLFYFINFTWSVNAGVQKLNFADCGFFEKKKQAKKSKTLKKKFQGWRNPTKFYTFQLFSALNCCPYYWRNINIKNNSLDIFETGPYTDW